MGMRRNVFGSRVRQRRLRRRGQYEWSGQGGPADFAQRRRESQLRGYRTRSESALRRIPGSERECASRGFDVVIGDDQSTPQGALTAAQKLVQQDHVYAVLPVSTYFYGAGQYAGTQA